MIAGRTLYPFEPARFANLLPLVSGEQWAAPARGALIAGNCVALADDPEQTSVVAAEIALPEGRALFLFGTADHPALAAFVHALTGPVLLVATDAITARIPTWRPDAAPRRWTTWTVPPAGTDTAFVALPPGGVRRLRPADARHLGALPPWLSGAYGSPEAMLHAGIAYARYLRAELVSLACIAAATEQYDVIAAYTIERTRRNGFARECAQRLVGAIVNERGNQPLMMCDAENAAAAALAESLRLTERHHRTVYRLP